MRLLLVSGSVDGEGTSYFSGGRGYLNVRCSKIRIQLVGRKLGGESHPPCIKLDQVPNP